VGISTSCVSSYALVRPPQEGFPCDTLQDHRDWKPAKRNSKGERQVRPANRHGLDLSSPSSPDGERDAPHRLRQQAGAGLELAACHASRLYCYIAELKLKGLFAGTAEL
jgi:hypothetical protein